MQPKIKNSLQDIWMAESREEAYSAYYFFIKNYEVKYAKATRCLTKDMKGILSMIFQQDIVRTLERVTK